MIDLVIAVVGDRRWTDYPAFSKILADELERFPAKTIVTGDATGVDTMALNYGIINEVPVIVYCASKQTHRRLMISSVYARLVSDWDIDGKGAGHIRNRYILQHPVQKVLLFDGGGPGSKNMAKQAAELGIEVERWEVSGIGIAPDLGKREWISRGTTL